MKRVVAMVLVGVLLAAVAVATGVAQDKPLKKVIFAVTTKDISVGHAAHSSLPRVLGYWKEEGLDVNVTSVEGSTAGLQQLAAGGIQVVSIGPEVVIIGREKGVPVKAFYVQSRQTIYTIVVPADSAIKDAAGFKGKTLGVPSLASGSVPYSRAWLAIGGVDPDKDVKFLAVGVGAPGRLALQQGKVDGLALWDTLQASTENTGMKLRRLDEAFASEVIGQSLAATDEFIAKDPSVLIGVARGIAKATVFGLANPEVAVRIHWKTYPQTRPTTGDDATNLKNAIHIFDARFAHQRVDQLPDKRFGAATLAQWQKFQTIFTEQKIVKGTTSPKDVYTDALINEINNFDQQAIIRQAKEYKL